MPRCYPRTLQVQTITGCVYEGVFHAADLSTGPDAVGVALKKAYKKSKANRECGSGGMWAELGMVFLVRVSDRLP